MQLKLSWLLIACFYLPLPLEAQNITLQYDASGNRISKTVAGTIPQPSIQGDTIACKGSIIQLTATGGNSYLWNIGGSQSMISVLADTTRTYTVIATGTNNCSASVTHHLTVAPIPLTGAISGDSLVDGNTVDTFTVPFHSSSIYTWNATNGSIINGNGTNKISILWNNVNGPGVINVYETLVSAPFCTSQAVHKTVSINTPNNSVAHHSSSDVLKLYPNPTEGSCWLELTLKERTNAQLLITDAIGKIVHSRKLNESIRYQILLESELFPSSGNYLVKIITDNRIYTEKLTVLKK